MQRKVRGMFLVLLAVLFLATATSGCGRSVSEDSRLSEREQAKTPAAGETQEPSSVDKLAEKKVLLVIAPKDFRDEEFFVPRRIFEEKGAVVTVASNKKGTATGMLGGTVEPDAVFSEVSPAECDAVVIAGGTGSKVYLWDDKELRRIVQEAYGQGKIVAAICLSPVVLARAGCLKGKEATVFPDPAAVRELKAAGVKYVDRDVVTAGSIVTARDPRGAEEFARTVARLLSGRQG